MKQIYFDKAPGDRRWDQYKAFHKIVPDTGGMLVLFETGELAVMNSRPSPYFRGAYNDFDIAITATGDYRYNFKDPDGTPIPTSWLTYKGQQYMLVDFTTKRAVRLALPRYWVKEEEMNARRPYHLSNARAYIPAPYAYPVGGTVMVHRTNKKLKQENKLWIKEVRHLCKVRHAVLNAVDEGYKDIVRMTQGWSDRFQLFENEFQYEPALFVQTLREQQLALIVLRGFAGPIEKIELPYLTI